MRRDFMLGMVFSAALAAAVSAQSPAQATPDQEKSGAKGNESAQTLTVTGCLKSASESGSSTAASPTATASPAGQSASAAGGGYILTDATTSSASSSTATGTAGSTAPNPAGASSSMSSGTTYRLTGSASNFTTLVGKKVEVKGTLQKSSSAEAGANPAGEPGAASSSRSDTSKAPQLRVTSVREVPGTCSSEGR